MKPFFILKQQDRILGCIPACAASVLNYLAIPGCWSEQIILQMYQNPPSPNGFHTLKNFLQAKPGLTQWEISTAGREIDLKSFLLEKCGKETPVLLAESLGEGRGAHCLVVAQANDHAALVFDPAPERPDFDWYCYDKLHGCWAGEVLWFQRRP